MVSVAGDPDGYGFVLQMRQNAPRPLTALLPNIPFPSIKFVSSECFISISGLRRCHKMVMIRKDLRRKRDKNVNYWELEMAALGGGSA